SPSFSWCVRACRLCAPDCTGVDPGTSVRDPTDCTRYYVCLDASGTGELVPSSVSLECPDGQYLNDAHTVPRCDPISGAPQGFCSNLCNPCKPHCTDAGGVTPHPTDCSTYYVCLENGHILEVGCPSDVPFFDFMSGECFADDTLCYSYCDPCLPHCTVDGERIPHPSDCTKFYLCSPPEIVSFTCPHNQVFNRETSQCEEDAVCVVDCPDTTDNPLI
ncbi:uncharacterized protein, partial [Panulirus ornatus]|uniref:uncharacterized protein n=1 Tax=Panulirus ornatus TaxID=150431 RepID=UPI003A8C12FF